CAKRPKDITPFLLHQPRTLKAPVFSGKLEKTKKAGNLRCRPKNWSCWFILFWAYLPTTKGLVARCVAFLAPLFFLFISWMRHSLQGGQRTRYVARISKGYRTMLTIHDQFTRQMGNRLKTTGMG